MQATTTRKMFSRETAVEVDIAAPPDTVWRLLTTAQDYPRWCTTVLNITGEIAPGSKIVLKSTLAPERSFKLKVKRFEPPRTLEWGDAMGTRSYQIEERGEGIVRFTMRERIGGPLFPLFAGMIPSFDESFDRFAADLKQAAEGKL